MGALALGTTTAATKPAPGGPTIPGLDILSDYYRSLGKTPPPSSYWQGLGPGAEANTATGQSAWEAWNTTWLSSPEGLEWQKQNGLTPATAAPMMSAARASLEAAQRQRRRAAVGTAGKVSTGTPTALQQQIGATGAPRTLIGS